MEPDWVDVHTHQPGRGISVVDPCLGRVRMPEDADARVYFSAGIHPMYLGEDVGGRLSEIEQAADAGRIVAVGEAGLDRNYRTAMEVQEEWFERQAEIAGRYDLPLIIHGVRAIPEVISVRKRGRWHNPWIIHGFNNRQEVLQDLLRHGFYISAGRKVMDEVSHISLLLPEIPADRLFVETDNSGFTIEEIYQKVAIRRGEAVGELKKCVYDNFKRLFRV